MRRANPLLRTLPDFLTWRAFRFRTICSGRLGFAGDTTAATNTKHLDTFTEQFEIGSRVITLETGKIARFANGAVVLAMENTSVLSTVTSAKGDAVRDFLPLTVSDSATLSLFLLLMCYSVKWRDGNENVVRDDRWIIKRSSSRKA